MAPADEDIPAGRVIVSPPRTLRPQDIAACCSAGLREIDVIRMPRVGILATGDELVPPTATPSIGRIIDSNSLLLRPLIERDGGQAIAAGDEEAGILSDNFEVIRSVVAALVERLDCVLISGGTSHGTGDHTICAVLRHPWGQSSFVALESGPRHGRVRYDSTRAGRFAARQPCRVPVRLRSLRPSRRSNSWI